MRNGDEGRLQDGLRTVHDDQDSLQAGSGNGLRIVLIALHEGAEMTKHKADGIISVQVLEGQLKFTTDLQSVNLSKGQMLALHERIPHSVLAIKETVFLLTLTTTLAEKPGNNLNQF